MVTPNRPASLDVRLHIWWNGLPPGTGITMDEMVEAMEVHDPQLIRNSLTRLRSGRVRDPSSDGHLVPKPVRYNSVTGMYYDLSRVTPDSVAAQVPGQILASQISELLTRAMTLESVLGRHGLALSASQYLAHEEIRELIAQLPVETMWDAHDVIQELARARQLLAVEEARRPLASLPPNSC